MSDNKIRRFESQMADMLPSMVRIAPGTIDIISSGAYQLPVGIYMSRERYEKLIAVAEAAKAHKDLDVTNLVSCRNYIGEIVLALVELEK